MNPRVVTIVAGLVMALLGIAGLLYPERIMGLLGFSVLNPSHAAAALGEVRATYGGLFLVMGIATILAAMDPSAHRSRILFVGLLWLGTCGGRLFGVFSDGNPGLFGWLTVAFELLVGGALVAAAQMLPSAGDLPRPTTPSQEFAPAAPPFSPPPTVPPV